MQSEKVKSGNVNAAGERQIDMLHGPMAAKLLQFALPIAATSILQQLFNSVDIAVVGRFVGTEALAAVGTNTAVIALFINCLVSLSVGTTVAISHRIGLMEQDGSDQQDEIQKIIHTSVLFAILCGTAMLLLGQIIARPILHLIGAPEEILKDAILYLRIYFLAAPAIMVYNFLSAILRSIGDTRRPLYILTASGIMNILLNVFLVVVCKRGVDGVAVATVASNLFSAVLLWIILMREKSLIRLQIGSLRIHGRCLRRILQIGGPASLQGMFFCISNICLQSGINSLGSVAVAASSAGLTFNNFAFYVVTGFNQAVLAFAGQNYGAGEHRRCKRVLLLGLAEVVLCASALIAVILTFRYFLLGLFTENAEVIELAAEQLMIILSPYCLVCIYELIGAWLRARGHSMEPALVVIVGSVFFRVLWLNTAFQKVHTFTMLYMVYPISWILTIVIMVTVCFLLTVRDR